MALDDKSERLAELEALSKQNDLAGGQNRQTISKLNQEIELLQDQIDDLERKESQNRKLLDEKVGILAHFEYFFYKIFIALNRK